MTGAPPPEDGPTAANDNADPGDSPLAIAYAKALELEKAGEIDAAAALWSEVLRLDPDDHVGAAIRLAALGRGPAPDVAPWAYVSTLFDQHADVFETLLVDQLGYDAPERIAARIAALGLGPFEALLDLGCGTGLAAEAVEDIAARRTGVDVSERMIEVAGEKDDLYHALYVADAALFLEKGEGGPWDLILAGDVLPYLGDVTRLFAGAAARAAPGAIFAFSTETAEAGAFAGRDWFVGPKQRYAHDPAHIAAALAAAGFEVLEMGEIIVRTDDGANVPGHLVFARRL